MATGESIGHMTDDVIWPRKVKVVTRYRKMQISRKRWEIEAQHQFTTNIKCHMGNRMDTWPVTSHDPISRKRLEIHTWSQWSTYRKWLLGIHWSHDRWRHMTPKGQGRDPDIRKCKYLAKRWQIEAQYQLTTNRKWYMGNRMDTWPITSCGIERWPNYIERLISRKRLLIFTAQCTLVQMRGIGIACRPPVRPSVCPSVRL